MRERPRRKRTLRWRLRKARNALGRRLGKRFGATAIRALGRSCTKTELDREHRDAAEREHGALLVAIWHGRGVLAAPFYEVEECTILVSASEDGMVAETILGRLGYEIIHGSSSRGGTRALREMIANLKSGKHLGITPDGPRGPMHSMSPGVAFLSRATGIPVLPIGFAVADAWHLSTWDRYTIPKPRSHIVACYQEPVAVPKRADGEELGRCSSLIRSRLRAAERSAFAHLGLEPDWESWVPEEELAHGGEGSG